MQNKNLKINHLDHIAIEVRDIDQSIQFYVGLLGLEELPTPESIKQNGIRWLNLNNKIALHLVEEKKATPPKTAHMAINVHDLSNWKTFLTEQGIRIHHPKFELYKAQRFFFFDPSGNRIEFICWQKDKK